MVSGTLVFDECGQLIKQGWHVTVIALHHKGVGQAAQQQGEDISSLAAGRGRYASEAVRAE